MPRKLGFDSSLFRTYRSRKTCAHPENKLPYMVCYLENIEGTPCFAFKVRFGAHFPSMKERSSVVQTHCTNGRKYHTFRFGLKLNMNG